MPTVVTMGEEERAIRMAEEECYHTVLSQPYPDDGRLYCNRTWDGWGCWNDTVAGTRAYAKCPSFMEGFDPRLTAYKDCTSDGTWWKLPSTNKSWGNYTTCINANELEEHTRFVYIFIAGYSVSIAANIVSLIIFIVFRQLQCDRVTLHKNLFASYILNGLGWILYYTIPALNVNILLKNPPWCVVLHVITQYFVASNFFWMFCEGLYLHTIIVVAFTSGKRLLMACFAFGWGAPILTSLIYAAARSHAKEPKETSRCWLNESSLQYIVLGPIILTLGLNLIFLCNIVRVLITKLRAVNSPDTNQTRKAVRATLILIPLLGLQYILLPFRPPEDSAWLVYYLYLSAIVVSFQGLFVAAIFCFANGEVVTVLKRKWGQHRLMQGKSAGRTSTLYTQTSMCVADPSNVSLVPPKSPRLYDNRCQAPGGKPPKPMATTKPFKIRKSLQSDYLDLEQKKPLEGNSDV